MFREVDHPRDNDGKFTDGSGGRSEKLEKAIDIYSDNSEEDKQNAPIKKSQWDNDLSPRGQTDIPDGENKEGFVQRELGVSAERAQEYVDAIDAYADNVYSQIKDYQTGKSVENQDEIAKISDDLEDYIKKAPRWNGGETFRGIGLSDKDLQEYTVGSEHDMRGVSSWSNEQSIAEEFAQENKSDGKAVIFHSPTQTKGTAIRHLSKYPGDSGENEVLVSQDSKYRVLKRETDQKGRVHIHVEEA